MIEVTVMTNACGAVGKGCASGSGVIRQRHRDGRSTVHVGGWGIEELPPELVDGDAVKSPGFVSPITANVTDWPSRHRDRR